MSEKMEQNLAQVRKLNGDTVIADRCQIANTFFSRGRGLLGRKSFKDGEGLLITACNNIHMWFMSVSIDVVFLSNRRDSKDSSGIPGDKIFYQVSAVRPLLRPWTLFPVWDFKSVDTLELPEGTISRCGIKVGDELCISW